MKFAVIYKVVDMQKNAEIRPRHVAFLKKAVAEGISGAKVVGGYKFPDYQEGDIHSVLICEAESKEVVTSWFEQDPIVSGGSRTIEVREAESLEDTAVGVTSKK